MSSNHQQAPQLFLPPICISEFAVKRVAHCAGVADRSLSEYSPKHKLTCTWATRDGMQPDQPIQRPQSEAAVKKRSLTRPLVAKENRKQEAAFKQQTCVSKSRSAGRAAVDRSRRALTQTSCCLLGL